MATVNRAAATFSASALRPRSSNSTGPWMARLKLQRSPPKRAASSAASLAESANEAWRWRTPRRRAASQMAIDSAK